MEYITRLTPSMVPGQLSVKPHFNTACQLKHPVPSEPLIIEVNVSDTEVGVKLSL